MSGPPIGVDPWKATNHRLITRPRIEGSAASCSVELPVAMNEMLAQPTSARAASSIGKVGASAASMIAAPKATAASTSGRSPVRPIAATTSPPATAPAPIAAVMNP